MGTRTVTISAKWTGGDLYTESFLISKDVVDLVPRVWNRWCVQAAWRSSKGRAENQELR